jgi:hypothetical protein
MSELRENSIADLLSDLSQESVELIRQELRLVLTDVVAQGREVGTSAGFLGGAAALGVGAFGALTAGLIAAVQRRPSRGALLVAGLYGAGAAGLTNAGIKRLGKVAPELLETIQRDVKATAKGASRASKPPSGDGARRKKATDGARRKKSPAKRPPSAA